MKIVLIGGGSYVFAPTVMDDVILKAGLSGGELALVDLNAAAVRLMAAVGERIAAEQGVAIKISATDDRTQALQGADFVITSVAVEGAKRWLTDYAICQQAGIPNELRECGALSGISYGFRNITLLLDIARDMEKICPNAILLNVSNPLTRVQTALHRYTDIQSYGFCSVAQWGQYGYEKVASVLGCHYNDIEVVSAGINHFAWLTSVKDKATGADLLPVLLDKLQKSPRTDDRILWRWYEIYGAVAAPPIDHASEFMPAQPDLHYQHKPPYHGSPAERQQRLEDMQQVASGAVDYKTIPHFLGTSWEHPGYFAAMLFTKSRWALTALNVPNAGCLPQLPEGVIVEVPAQLQDGAVILGKDIQLPPKAAAVCRDLAEIAEMTARACAEGDTALAMSIIDVDVAITQKAAAKKALSEMLKAHADLLPQFARP